MIHPVPPGTRDVLPDEMRELRAVTNGVRAVFEDAGYGEVRTPSMEYEDVLKRGDERSAGAGYRLFDEQGQVLVLRSDMTIPIARVVSARYRDVTDPIRLCYFQHAYRAVETGRGQPREFMQAGVELIGAPAPEGDAEVISLTLKALDEVGLTRHRIGVGDGGLYRSLLERYEVPEEERMPLLESLTRRDLVGLEMRIERLGLPDEARRLLTELPMVRGGAEVLDGAPSENLRAIHELVGDDRLIFDLGLVRELGYYTGAVFEVYDPAVGFALGGGGRYDDLLGRFGDDRPACGIALDVTRVHIAQAGEERLG